MNTQQRNNYSSILYVEDDAITRKQLSKYLKLQCKVLYVASDGKEGLALYKKFKPDVVITDIEMPKLNGLDLAKEIRKISLSTQVIITTTYRKLEYLMEAVDLHLVRYLVKPISIEKLTDALNLSSEYLDNVKIKTNPKKYIGENIYYDIYKKELVDKNKVIDLSKYERALMELLIASHPAPISYDYIDENIYDYSASKNSIRLLIGALRNKIGKELVVNLPGYGYKIFMDEKEAVNY